MTVYSLFNKNFYTLLSLLFGLTTIAQVHKPHEHIEHEQKLASSKINFKASSETNNYDIIYHKVNWEVDPEAYYIKGSVLSYFKALANNFNTVNFDIIDALTIDSVTSNGQKLSFNHKNNLVAITLEKPLSMHHFDSVTIYYQGIPDASSGFTAFDTAYHNGVPSLWTLSEPYGAREWWPCKQSLTDKIDSIDIFVRTPKMYKVGSNGKLMYEQITGNEKLTYWKHRYPITTYLVAIAVTNYEEFSHFANVDEENSVEIVNYVYPEDKEWAETDALETVKIMEFFSEIFIPYPFYKEKYGHAQFGWRGGMEHQTMSFMKHFSEPLITHELAHQWFGDYVTCASWQHIWINEGFAEFCESLAQERFYPGNWSDWKKNEIEAVIENAESGSVFVDDTTNVSRIFDRYLTYKKGGLILQLLRTQVGDEAFFSGIRNYLNNDKIANGFATAEDFKQFIETEADTSLTQFFDDWYYGEGYPIYQIEWTQDAENNIDFTISQSTTHASVMFFALKIPVLLKGENKEQLIELHNTSNNQRFVFNPGFYVEEIVFNPYYNIITPKAEIKFIINESDNSEIVEIMPNPANNVLNIKAGRGIGFSKIDILSTSGKQTFVKNYNIDTRKTEINIKPLQSGVYYIRIITSRGEIIKRFVKA